MATEKSGPTIPARLPRVPVAGITFNFARYRWPVLEDLTPADIEALARAGIPPPMTRAERDRRDRLRANDPGGADHGR